MTGLFVVAATIAFLLVGIGCRPSAEGTSSASESDSTMLEARVARLTEALANADSDSGSGGGQPVARWLLPSRLAEISGLALTPDGRLFAHSDESSAITELDYRRGTIIKQFFVGPKGWHGDFEGLAYAEDRFFLLESNGNLYEFREGAAEERVDYKEHDNHLGKECEFEGLAYDSTANALILSCKNVGIDELKDMLVLYRYDIGNTNETGVSEVTVPLSEAIGANGWKKLRPSDITVDPLSGNYVLVSSQEKALVALTPTGAVVFSRPLPDGHPQSEGIAITRDGILIISDEAVNTAAAITLYSWP